ncbi:MAG: aminotransferase class I/II-fold pyridoxal phosphate-dependent enzyme [Flavobacteriales bacterium]|nr:aminotransferase class I/II-fold pyridoxal phosphate-dependent enzyme [Flavobacteriales bacterium]
MLKALENALEKRREEDRLRMLRDELPAVDFSSNDYLGLGAEEVSLSADRSSASSSRSITGNYPRLRALEIYLAERFQGDEATFFQSGFEANQALFSMLSDLGVTVLFDEHIHASIRSSLFRSRGKAWSFKHNDLTDLRMKLNRSEGECVVVTEGLFSMHGDSPDLEAISALKSEIDFALIVDEAHSNGFFGEHGIGTSESQNIIADVNVRIQTFGKAFGIQGAAIVQKRESRSADRREKTSIKEALANFSRPFIYTTAPSPLLTELCFHGLRRWERAQKQRELLGENIQHYLMRAKHFEEATMNRGQVQFYSVGGNGATLQCSQAFSERGYDLKAILSPTVPEGQEGLRICLHAFNSKAEIDAIFDIFDYIRTN